MTKLGEPQIFVRLLRCPDCGKTFSFNLKNGKGNYSCSHYRRYCKYYCSMHYIAYDVLYRVVLDDIRVQARTAILDPEKLLEQLTQSSELKTRQGLIQIKKEIANAERRIGELNGIIKRFYEDNLSGKLTDERFKILSQGYEDEQKTLKTSLDSMKAELSAFADKKDNSERFAEIIRKYSNIKELTPAILNELIDKIVITKASIPKDANTKVAAKTASYELNK